MNKSILICDDSIEEIRVLVSMLRSANYRLIISSNGRDACSRASALRPDLILLDVRMPMMDGFATCRVLKAHADTREMPVIFLTAANEIEDRLEGLRIGAVDYIVKPAEVEEVLLRIAIHIRQVGQDSDLPPVREIQGSNSALIEATCKILEGDLSRSLSIDDLAHMVGTHRYRLSTAFKEAFGSTVYAWLRERRMKQACTWLGSTSMSMQSIAEELGFTTSGNFSTAFKERYGTSPREYRKMVNASGAEEEVGTS